MAGKEAAFRAAHEATRAAQEHTDVAHQRCSAAQRRIQDLQRDVAQIREAGRSKLAAFGGQAAVRLTAALQRCKGQFSRPPIGPVGQHLTLKDSRWGLLTRRGGAGCTAGSAATRCPALAGLAPREAMLCLQTIKPPMPCS